MKLAKTYTPNEFEPGIYALWEESGAFAPTGKGEPYSIVMPPPNANANLHTGHALDMNLKDILARYHRMRGRDVAFIPGADHAGFETWVVYERTLNQEGKSRFDYSREQLYSQVWDFVERNRGNMELQLRALGVSADWDDGVFTLDAKVIDTVYDTFKRLWDDQLVYRGERIVNYCTVHQTSFADIEVVHKNETSKLWQIAYPTLDHIGEIIVATTRPETLLGDTAVAVHPEDERYKHLIGTRVLLPITNREVTIIADEHVDREFGTGAVKITPAHDVNDFEMAERHNLEIINIIDRDGTLINVPAQFIGLTVAEARQRVLASLKATEALRGETDLEHAVGHCYKCDTVIEPMMMDQWFVKMKPLADAAIARIESGDINFVPATKAHELTNYLSQLRDWNISRQIPWGIPIPAFQNVDDHEDWIFDRCVDDRTIEVDGKTYRREEDTFDTWFSSGQWPYIVTDALSGGKLARFYPTTVMETGSDLLRQWVARMIIFGVYRTDQVPFRDVYFHGMVNDEHNQKMSKSKGNVINPMEMVAEYGSDALRLGIIAGRAAGQSQAFNRGAVVAGRNFCNKLWNIARFVEARAGEVTHLPVPQPMTIADHWILRQLDTARRTIDRQLSDYRFAEAGDTVYHVVWDDVADWFVEASKTNDTNDMLIYVLDTALRLAHPFAPFVTETIWQSVAWHEPIDDMAITATWPADIAYSDIAAAEFDRLRTLVSEVRFVVAELPGNDHYRLLYLDDSLVADNAHLLKQLVKELDSVEQADTPHGLRIAATGRDVWLDISSELLYEHQSNLERRLAETRQSIEQLQKRLDTPSYVDKAPARLVDETRQQLASLTEQLTRMQAELDVISNTSN